MPTKVCKYVCVTQVAHMNDYEGFFFAIQVLENINEWKWDIMCNIPPATLQLGHSLLFINT